MQKDHLKGKNKLSHDEVMTASHIEKSIENRLINKSSGNKERIFKDSMKILLENIEKKITIRELCSILGTNSNTLSKIFNEKIRQSPSAWIKKERLEISAKLLIKTNCKVYQIAYEVGYSDPNNFSTAFKNYFGSSPEVYRKSKKKSVN
ncbi:MAG: helix-turn-helix transcriptional regulator [Endozoicomonadaceae bacterium]|nr:helix-turn-helix transcriptional regulator [Endozoicomonadaceae bacterium]